MQRKGQEQKRTEGVSKEEKKEKKRKSNQATKRPFNSGAHMCEISSQGSDSPDLCQTFLSVEKENLKEGSRIMVHSTVHYTKDMMTVWWADKPFEREDRA